MLCSLVDHMPKKINKKLMWLCLHIIYFKTFCTLDHNYKLCHNTSCINLGSKTKNELFYFGNGLQNLFNRKEAFASSLHWVFSPNSVWKQHPEQSNSPLSWHACLPLPDKCNNRVTPPTLLLRWVVPFTCLWKGPFWSLANTRLAAHHPGMITLSDEKTQEDDMGVMGWKSACCGAKHIS